MIIFKSDSFFLTFFSQHLLRWNFLKSTRKTQKHGFSASGTQSNVRYNILLTTSLSVTDYTQLRQPFLICLLATQIKDYPTVAVTFTFYLRFAKRDLTATTLPFSFCQGEHCSYQQNTTTACCSITHTFLRRGQTFATFQLPQF